jgi:hypothetical protein
MSAPPRERALAWTMDGLACLYVVWVFSFHWRNADMFKRLFEGLGMELPIVTRFVVDHAFWLCPTLMLAFSVGIVVKELFMDDKRFSVMITCFVALIAQLVAQAMTAAYYLPMQPILGKLS